MGIRKTWRANPNFADSSNLKAFSFFLLLQRVINLQKQHA